MSLEDGRFIGIGIALVDHVYTDGQLEFPSAREDVLPFIKRYKPTLKRAGGPIPNTFSALSRLSTNRKLKLLSCVGADDLGSFFGQQTDPRVGPIQIHPTEPTGVWVGLNSPNGDLKLGLSSYGAALKVRVFQKELEEAPNAVFITDISSCKHEEIHSQTDLILKQLRYDGGLFVLSGLTRITFRI